MRFKIPDYPHSPNNLKDHSNSRFSSSLNQHRHTYRLVGRNAFEFAWDPNEGCSAKLRLLWHWLSRCHGCCWLPVASVGTSEHWISGHWSTMRSPSRDSRWKSIFTMHWISPGSHSIDFMSIKNSSHTSWFFRARPAHTTRRNLRFRTSSALGLPLVATKSLQKLEIHTLARASTSSY